MPFDGRHNMDNSTSAAAAIEMPVAASSSSSSSFKAVKSSRYYPHESGNSSLTTSVTIRVTPEHFHLISWGILWGGFVLAILIAAWQVRIENQWFTTRRREVEQGSTAPSGDGEAVSSADLSRSRVSNIQEWFYGLFVRSVDDYIQD
jgi:hypothetical protein